MKYDPHEIYAEVREKGTVVLDFEKNTDSDWLVSELYGITEQVACVGKDQPDGSYKLTIEYTRIFD